MTKRTILNKAQSNHIFGGLVIIIAFYASQLLTSVLFLLLGTIMGDKSTETSEVINMVFSSQLITEGLLAVMIIAYYKDSIKNKLQMMFDEPITLGIKLIGYSLLIMVTNIAVNILNIVLFPEQMTQVGENQNIINTALMEPTMAMILLMCLVAPIVEEYVFRYGLITKLLHGVNKWISVIVAAFLFAFAHIGFSQMSDPALFTHLLLLYMPSAMIFGFVYVKENNIIYPITLHAMGNIWAIMIIMSV